MIVLSVQTSAEFDVIPLPALVRLTFFVPPCNQLPSPLKATLHHYQEAHVYHLSRNFGFYRTQWIKTCSRTTGSGWKPPNATTDTSRAIDIP